MLSDNASYTWKPLVQAFTFTVTFSTLFTQSLSLSAIVTTTRNNPSTMASSNTNNDPVNLGSADSDKNPVQSAISEADDEAEGEDSTKNREIELEEERKLKLRNPSIQRPGSEFLQKRLQRGQKYFDSGDYNMAKASTNPDTKVFDGATPVTAIDSKLLNRRH